jgi:hypothetical protein
MPDLEGETSMATELLTTSGAISRLSLLPPAEAIPIASAVGDALSPPSGRYISRYDAGLDQMCVFDADGAALDHSDAVCLSAMLSEVIDEMGRRGFDPASASFVIDPRHPAASTAE